MLGLSVAGSVSVDAAMLTLIWLHCLDPPTDLNWSAEVQEVWIWTSIWLVSLSPPSWSSTRYLVVDRKLSGVVLLERPTE